MALGVEMQAHLSKVKLGIKNRSYGAHLLPWVHGREGEVVPDSIGAYCEQPMSVA